MLIGSSNQVLYAIDVDDFFSRLNLNHALLYFPNFNKESRRIMESILQWRSTLGLGGLEVMDTLDRLLTLPYNISTLTNPN
jgi:hypothetical protein